MGDRSCGVLTSALVQVLLPAIAKRLGPMRMGLRVGDPNCPGRRSTLIRGVGPHGVLILAGAVGAAMAALTPAAVLAAPPGGPPTQSASADSVSAGGASGAATTSSFTCSIGGTVSTIETASNVVPDPVLGGGATPFLSEPTIATTPANLPAGMLGITATGPTTGTISSPAVTFAAGFADETELYEVPNTATVGPAPDGSPGAFDTSQGAPLNALPLGTITVAGATHTGAGLPYAQVFPVLNGTPNFTDPLIPGGIPTSVYYQSYSNNPGAWMPGGEQPPSLCGGSHEYAVITFDTAPYVGSELTAGQPYAAYLLVRDTDTSGPLSNHIWYFQAAAPPLPQPSLAVTVTNDAAGQAVYKQTETASAPGESVPFQVNVTNTSSAEETVGTITQGYGGASTQVCQENLGQILSPGGSVACRFTLADFSPPSGQSLTDTVTVDVAQLGDPTNVAAGQSSSTVTTQAAPSPPITVQVAETNDAAQQGIYQQTETAPAAGAPAPFRVIISNTSRVAEEIRSITDFYPGHTLRECSDLLGATLTVGQSVDCSFTIAGYAPGAGLSLTDTAVVGVSQVGNPGNTGSGRGASTVVTAAPELTVTETVGAATANLGQSLRYTITVTNHGTAAARDVVIRDVLSGTAGYSANDGTGGTPDSFAGAPVVPVTKTAVGAYEWIYPTVAANGGTAIATYTVTIEPPGSAAAISNGKVTLVNTVSATTAIGCSPASCLTQVTTVAGVPAGSVQAASTSGPGTPSTGTHLALLPAGILVLLGLALMGIAAEIRPKVGPGPTGSSSVPPRPMAGTWPRVFGDGGKARAQLDSACSQSEIKVGHDRPTMTPHHPGRGDPVAGLDQLFPAHPSSALRLHGLPPYVGTRGPRAVGDSAACLSLDIRTKPPAESEARLAYEDRFQLEAPCHFTHRRRLRRCWWDACLAGWDWTSAARRRLSALGMLADRRSPRWEIHWLGSRDGPTRCGIGPSFLWRGHRQYRLGVAARPPGSSTCPSFHPVLSHRTITYPRPPTRHRASG